MKSIPALCILADDITGAADCAARCKGAGLPVTILIGAPVGPLPDGVLSFSSDSRYLPPTQAAACVQRIYGELCAKDARRANAIWYKKIDSTLRGNLGAELEALLAVTTAPVATAVDSTAMPTRSCAVITSAFPAQGRGLVDGYLVYDQAPAQARHLPSLLREQSPLPLAALDLAAVRAGVAPLAATLTAHYAAGIQLFVADALTEADLATLYAATRQALPQALYCGSAGLIGVIAATLVAEAAAEEGAIVGTKPPHSPQIMHPMLGVVGSGSSMAQRQLAQLRRHAQVTSYMVDPQVGKPVSLPMAKASSADLVLHLPPPSAGAQLEGAPARHYAAVLATAALQQIQQRRPQTLLVVGGDTAIHLLELLGVHQLQVEAELQPGMPLTVGRAADGHVYQIILKAGNHGNEETLVNLFGL